MKKIFATLFLAGTFAVASAQVVSFDKTTMDYGTVKSGADGHRVFTVKNTGDKPLIISKVQASCGCTVPEWSQEPIMPGKTGAIKVLYDTKIVGPFTKIIEVYTNDPANSRSVINIKGTVDAVQQVKVAQEVSNSAEINVQAAKAMPAKARKAEKAVSNKVDAL
jgi:hypothetical protein